MQLRWMGDYLSRDRQLTRKAFWNELDVFIFIFFVEASQARVLT